MSSSAVHLFARDAVSSLRGSGPPTLNWLFIVECAVVFVLVIFYFFYVNRLLGLVAAWILRLCFWRSSNSYFEIGGLQISLLGGRIQFNDFRYISRNQSLRIVRGHITWKYWLRHVRSEEDKPSVSLSGAEWFLYNRTPSYDAILEQLGLQEHDPLSPSRSDASPVSLDKTAKDSRGAASVSSAASSIEQIHHDKGEKEREKRRREAEGKSKSTDWLREALPIQVKCKKGAIIIGNPSTPSILIAGFEGVGGTYAAVKARSALDAYKQVYHFVFEQPKIVFRTNPDYEEGMAAHGQTVMDKMKEEIPDFSIADLFSHPTRYLSLSGFLDLVRRRPKPGWRARRKAAKSSKKPSAPEPPTASSWTGLPRYQTPEDDPDSGSSAGTKRTPLHPVEYAKVTTLVTSPEIEMTYYADVAGLVPEEGKGNPNVAGLETHDVGNGDLSPEWGVDLVVKGGAVTYGPWADRQRASLQSAFMPATYFNGLETPKLQPGDQRMHTALKVFVEFSEGATMRVPTREASKDWKYDNVDPAAYGDSVVRPYGWLDITLGPNSTLTYVLPMVATTAGYDTLLEAHLDDLNIASSVNYAPFLHAESCRVHCGLPSPLVWDEKRTWTITTKISRPDISLLRDHITLFADLGKDFTSGPPGDYDHFVPFLYEMNIEVRDYVIQLYVNDHNIINNPTTPEDNSLLILSGPRIDVNLTIPSDEYRMECSNINFNLADLVLSMSLPDWNTHSAFLTDRTRTFATAPSLSLDGTYRYYSNAHPDNVEKLTLNSRDIVFKALGWMIRHLFNLKDNYAGNFTHFVTLEEYRHRHERNLQGDPLELKYRPGKTDVFEVAVAFELDNGLLLLPQEMTLNVDPFRIMEIGDCPAALDEPFERIWEHQTDSLRIQGLDITANRLFGPQARRPRTATYMCIWSFYLGSLVGSVPPSFLQALARAGSAVGVSFSDVDNMIDFTVPLDPDATVLTVDIHSIDVAVRGQTTAVQLHLPRGVDLRFDDLASPPFLKHLAVDVPELTIRALAPLFGRAAPWMEVASVDADLSVVLGFSSAGWEAKAREQLSFIALQDSLTKRCPFIYGEGQPGWRQPSFFDEGREKRLEDDDTDSSDDYGSESDTSSDDAHTLYARLPGRDTVNDRFSAYGAVLRLCERAPEHAFLDRPTFQRLPRPDGSEPKPSRAGHLPTTKERLKRFGPSKLTASSTSRTAIDLMSLRPIRFVATPVAVQVGADILSGISLDDNLEHCLDDMYTDFLDAQNKLPKIRFSELEFKAVVPSIEVEVIQDVLRPEDTISLHHRDNHGPEAERGGATVLCTVQLALSDVNLEYRHVEDGFGGNEHPAGPVLAVVTERVAKGGAGSTRLQVFHPEQSTLATSRRRHVLPVAAGYRRTRPTALDLVFGRCEAHLDYSPARILASLTAGDARLDFVDEAAELIIGAIWSWRVVNDIIGPASQREAERRALIGNLVWAVVKTSEDASITSVPVFLNRVSYLVSSSTTLRIDDAWKIIHNLRHCLRLAPAPIHAYVQQRPLPPPHQQLDDLLRILRKRPTWDVDVDDLVHSPFLAKTYGSPAEVDHLDHPPTATSTEMSWATTFAFEWRTGSLDARFWNDGAAEVSDNRLMVGPLEAFVASSGLRAEQDEVRLRAKATLASVDAAVGRELLHLVRHIVGVRRTFEHKIQRFTQDLAASVHPAPNKPSGPSSSLEELLSSLPIVVVDLAFGIKHLGAVAQADDLQTELVVSDATTTVFGRLEPRFGSRGLLTSHVGDLNTSFGIGGVGVFARDVNAEDEDVLLAAQLDQLVTVVQARGARPVEGEPKLEVLQPLLSIKAVHFTVPRDAGLEELPSSSAPAPKPDSQAAATFSPHELLASAKFDVQAVIEVVEFQVQAIPTLRASYTLRHLSAYSVSTGATTPRTWLQAVDAGFHVGAQTVRFVPVLKGDSPAATLPTETAFELPVIRLKVHADDLPTSRVSMLTTVDSISVKLNADIIDNILTVQNHFGSDIDDLVRVLQAKRDAQAGRPSGSRPRTKSVASLPAPSSPAASSSVEWDARVALRGLKIAVQGPQAVQWIEAELLEGSARTSTGIERQHLQWQASVQNLALSLEQRTSGEASPSSASPTDRRYRLAFFRLDLNVSNAEINLPELPSLPSAFGSDTPHLHVRLPRIHAVIQPIAIEALGDLVDHFVQEIQDRRHSRKQEVEALQSRVISTLDISEDDQKARSWLSSCVLSVEAQSVGMAIPLDADEGVSGVAAARRRRAKSAQSRPAFLVSLPSVKFAAQKGSAGFARIERFSVQFVANFDQGRKEDFDGDTHRFLNRILLPEMKCTVRSPSNEPTLLHSKVSGLEVDLEPSVVSYAFALVDVYRLSHERFGKFALETAPGAADEPAGSAAPSSTPSAVKATFEFASGAIRMHSPSSKDEQKGAPPLSASTSTPRPKAHRRGKSLGDFASLRRSPGKTPPERAPDTFRLPALSMWAEYQEDGDEQDHSRLHVDVVIHKSNNTLYPTLLPFISAVARQVKERALQQPTPAPLSSADDRARSPETAVTAAATPPPAPTFGRLQLSISLRIDQSRLEISCLPSAEVTARLTWESGGFLLNTSPGAKGVDFALSVDGVAAGLRHSFSPEDCLLAEAKGLAASVSFSAVDDSAGTSDRVLSVVVNLPDVAGEMNFRHLQDWLCLKAVWLDRIDLGPPDTPSPPSEALARRPKESPLAVTAPSRLTTIVRAEISTVRFMSDLGPAIGRVTLVAQHLAARLRWVPSDSREFSLGVEGIEVSGQGRAGGGLQVGRIWFATRLRDDQRVFNVDRAEDPQDLLHIELKLGKVDAAIEYEFHRILVLAADPIEVAVTDDWSQARSENSELTLGFRVKMGEFNVIGTTATVPTLVGVANRVQALIDEKAAAAENVLIAAGMQPRRAAAAKVESAISVVASSFGHSGTSASTNPECPVRIVNRLQIELDRIRLAVFPDHWNDGEVFRVDAGGSIKAELVRGIDAENRIQRQLRLFLGFFSIRKVNHRKLSPSQESEYDVHEWYALLRTSSERNIFKIGATEVKMDSEQAVGSYRLKHKFSMLFGGHVDVALNYGLLRNLGTLATQYQMQMDRISGSSKSATGPAPSAHFTADPTAPLVPPPGASSSETTAKLTISEDAIPKREGEVVKMKPMPLVHGQEGESRSLEFEAVEMDVHQPQLQVLGDATPPLEWLGLQRDRFPAFVHTGVTSPIEELLIILSRFYGNQLARTKFNEAKSGVAGCPFGPPPPSSSS
ncbi:hypothetical protein JCM8097_004593 [Rhodosporidiobolus ruineniae]